MEAPAWQMRPDSLLGRALARLPAGLLAPQIVDTLANGQSFDKGAVTQEYLVREYQSYWGWFGWLSLPLQLPAWQYDLLTWFCLAAVAGWLGCLVRWPRAAGAPTALGLISFIALGTTIGLGLARQMTQWALYDLHDFPQGRYLFVLIIPSTWLLLTGMGQLLGLVESGLPRRLRARLDRGAVGRWGGWVGLNLLIFFDLYALLVVLLPYYYGRF